MTLEHRDTPAPASGAALRPATLAIAALFAFIVLVQGISAPFQKDAEPQSAEWIQSIVRDGHWLIPHDAYGYTDRKPPLFYWLSALVADASGGTVNEVRARAVSVVAGTALAVAVLAWTVANVGAPEGWIAFLFMLGTYGFASRATEALTDMLLTFLLFAAYCAIYPLLDAPTSSGSARRKIFVGAMLGLGILTKGPVAIVLCALAVTIYLLIERRNPLAMLRERWPWQVVADRGRNRRALVRAGNDRRRAQDRADHLRGKLRPFHAGQARRYRRELPPFLLYSRASAWRRAPDDAADLAGRAGLLHERDCARKSAKP